MGQSTRERDFRILDELMPHLEGITPDNAVQNIDEALRKVGLDGDPEVLYHLLSYRAEQLYYEGLFDEAMLNALNALEIAQDLDDSLMIANEYNLIGLLYENVQNDHDAIPYLRDALRWFPAASELRYPMSERYQIHCNLGQCLLRIGELDSAQFHLELSRAMARSKHSTRGEAIADRAMGQVMLERDEGLEAVRLFKRSIATAAMGPDPDVTLGDLSDLARAWVALGFRDSALIELRTGQRMLTEEPVLNTSSRLDFLRSATKIYTRLGMDEPALRTMREWHATDSAISDQNKRAAVLSLKGLYDTNAKLVNERYQRQLYADALERVRYSRKIVLISGALGLLGIIGSYFVYMSRQRGKQQLAELEVHRLQQDRMIAEMRIREQLGRDIHDDLGAGLSGLKLQCELALRTDPSPAVQQQLTALAVQAGELMNSMRQIIWAMNHDQGSLEDLVAYCTGYARQYMSDNGLDAEVRSIGPRPTIELSSNQRRNVFLVMKEALHNVVKHANACHVLVRMEWKAGLGFTIEDNGKGIGSNAMRSTGNGVHNIELRIAALGGSYSYAGEQGTRLDCFIPLEMLTKVEHEMGASLSNLGA